MRLWFCAEVGDVVVHGEDVFSVSLEAEDVDHPGKDGGIKSAAFRFARVRCAD